MFVSACGYLYAMHYWVYRDGLSLKFFWGRADASLMTIILILFLVSASMWIHSTFAYLASPNLGTWTLIQIELLIT
ncbi:MAG: hypothetical protein QF842_01990 [Candidatus Marinimicrobia bacterium]|nr:hypothetical protein [Candidatus Neomarinimicrobiota bacterium]